MASLAVPSVPISMSCAKRNGQRKSYLGMMIFLGLTASAMLLQACATTVRIIPDNRIPHQLSRQVNAMIWVKDSSGKFVETPATIGEGWWIAAPELVK